MGLGYKNEEVANITIQKIKSREMKYQKSVVSTMLGRAKNHPSQTEDMRRAIEIYINWLQDHK